MCLPSSLPSSSSSSRLFSSGWGEGELCMVRRMTVMQESRIGEMEFRWRGRRPSYIIYSLRVETSPDSDPIVISVVVSRVEPM